MPITVECDDCGARFRVRDDHAGAAVRCIDCGERVPIGGRRGAKSRSRRGAGLSTGQIVGIALGCCVLFVVLLWSLRSDRGGGTDPADAAEFLTGDPPRREKVTVRTPNPRRIAWQPGDGVALPDLADVDWIVEQPEVAAVEPPPLLEDAFPLKRERGNVAAVRFTPDGTRLVVHKADNGHFWMDVYDVAARKHVRSFSVPPGRLTDISRDASEFALISRPGATSRSGRAELVTIGSFEDGTLREFCRPIDGTRLRIRSDDVHRFRFLDGPLLVCSNRGGMVVWSRETHAAVWQSREMRLMPGGVSRDGRYVVTQAISNARRNGLIEASLYVVEAATGRFCGVLPLRIERGQGVRPEAVVFHQHGSKLSAWTGQGVITWDLTNGRAIADFEVSRPIESGAVVFRRGQTKARFSTERYRFRAHGDHFLVADSYLVDPTLNDVTWQCLPPEDATVRYAANPPEGQHWFCIGPKQNDSQFLVSLSVPSPMASAGLAIVQQQHRNMPPPDQFLREGDSVSLVVNFDSAPLLRGREQEVEQYYIERLAKEGLKVAANQRVTFVIRATQSKGDQRPLVFKYEDGHTEELEPIELQCSRRAFVDQEQRPRWEVTREVTRFAPEHVGQIMQGIGKLTPRGLTRTPTLTVRGNVNPATRLRELTRRYALGFLKSSVPMRLYTGPPDKAPPMVTGGVSVLSVRGEVGY